MAETLTIIDSSLGGALLVNSLRSLGYSGSLWLILDTQNFPLDTKSPQISFRSLHFCLQVSRKIGAQKTIVACPSMASVMQKTHMLDGDLFSTLDVVKERFSHFHSKSRVGIVSTESLEKLNPSLIESKVLFQIKTPLVAQLAHEGWHEDPLANLILYRHLSIFLQKQIDSLILTPSYWGFFKENVTKIFGSQVQVLDPISTLSNFVCGNSRDNGKSLATNTADTHIITSDTSETFIHSLKRILNQGINYQIEALMEQPNL